MEQNNQEEKVFEGEVIKYIEPYKEAIIEMEVSNDTSVNLQKVQDFIQSVIMKEPELTQNDVVELMKVAKEHFSFDETTKHKLIEYCKNSFLVIQAQRKEEDYQLEILKRAETGNKINKIFPAIDYRKDLGMIYGIKGLDEQGNEITYIGMSNQKIYEIKRAKEFGIIPSHEENIDSNFSLKAFGEYVKGKTVKANILYSSIKQLLKKYVVVSDEFFDVIVSYIMMTYIYILFQVIPYLWINGEKGTGKSTIMKIMSKLCFNTMFCSNVNPANIFRQIDNDGSTIILDEFEKMYGEDKQEIIKILNQGFNIDGVVPRCVGQNNQIRKFRSFSPKIMGGISNIDDVLFERVIKYTTMKVNNISVPKFRESEDVKQEISKLVDDLYIFGLIYAPQIKDIYDKSEVGFKGYTLREDDLWNPLLCIAKVIDEENNNTSITDNLLRYAKKLSNEKFKRNIENEPKLQLLYYLYSYFETINAVTKKLNNQKYGVELVALYKYLSCKDELNWIKGSSSLGKKLTQWYGFDKKREIDSTDYELSGKKTYYIFNQNDILQIMKENHIRVEDYE